MRKRSNVAGQPRRAARLGRLPVLTDEVALRQVRREPPEPPVRLAWDNSRLPVLTDEVDQSELPQPWRATRGRV
jgi:hypothetical protein